MYPLHCNYVSTLPCKRITMKITIFIIVLVLKSNENIRKNFRLPQLANISKLCKNSFFEDGYSKCPPPAFTQARSFLTQYGLVDGVLWQIMPHCMQDFLQLVDGIWLVYT